MQATHVESIRSITSDDDDDHRVSPLTNERSAFVSAQDGEAQTSLLRPLEKESHSLAGYCVTVACGGVLATASESRSSPASSDPSSGSADADADVKNSSHPRKRLSTIVDKEPDRAGPVVSSSTRGKHKLQQQQQQQQQQQTKHGNQTNESGQIESGATVTIMDLSGGQNGPSVVAVSCPPSDQLDEAPNKEDTRLAEAATFSKIFVPTLRTRSPPTISSANSMGGESLTSSGGRCDDNEDTERETMTGSEVTSIGDAKSDHLWSPPMEGDLRHSFEAETLRMIEALNEKRRELQDMDRQLSDLVANHLRSIGRTTGPEAAWYVTTDYSAKTDMVFGQKIDEHAYGFDKVIDLTTSASKMHHSQQDRAHKVGEEECLTRPTRFRAEAKSNCDDLGQHSSVNLRKSRLLSATVDLQQAITSTAVEASAQAGILARPSMLNHHQICFQTNDLPQYHNNNHQHKHHHQQEEEEKLVPLALEHVQAPRAGSSSPIGFAGGSQQRKSPSDGTGGERQAGSPKRSSMEAPETLSPSASLDCSPELTHDIQKLKRLKLSGHSISSSGAFRSSSSSSSTTADCNTIQSLAPPAPPAAEPQPQPQPQPQPPPPGPATGTKTTVVESNVDLLRDFMLHNQYLPSHLVLECLSQCQKQTSASSLSSIMFPSAMCLLDASSPMSSPPTTTRNQTGSALMDFHQQINQRDLLARQRGSANFHELNYHSHQQISAAAAAASSLAILDGSADQQQAPLERQQAARSRAFVLATSHLGQNRLTFASHHPNNTNNNTTINSNNRDRDRNNNWSSGPPMGSSGTADDYHLALPMTRHSSNNNNSSMQLQSQLHSSQEALELLRATMSKSNHHHHHQQQQQQQSHHHHHHLISMADIQRVAFKCHVCGSGFEDRHRLQQHLSIHLNLQPEWFEEKTITETMAQYESKRGDYLCGICDIRFETTAEFDKHMQAHGDKPHRCDLCNQDNKLVSFRYYRQLLTHLRSHCFLYSCRFAPDCKQTSNRKDYLKLHILKHHLNNQLPKQYTICCH